MNRECELGEALASTRELIRNDLVRTILVEVDRAIERSMTKEAIAVFETIEDKAFDWYPKSALFLTVYVRLIDQGWVGDFDWAYFAGLPGTPDGLVEAIRGMGGAQLH